MKKGHKEKQTQKNVRKWEEQVNNKPLLLVKGYLKKDKVTTEREERI